MFLKLLEKHFLKKYINWFLTFYIGINALAVIFEFLGHIDIFIKEPFKFYEAYKKYLYITFPIIVYFSICFFYSEVRKSKEDIIVESLGINFFSIIKPIILILTLIIFGVYFQAKLYGYKIEKRILLFTFSYISMLWGILISQEKDFSFIILGFVVTFSIFNILSSMINFHIIDIKILIIVALVLFLPSLGFFIKTQKNKGLL